MLRQAYILEKCVQDIVQEQEAYGFCFNAEKAEALVKELDEKMEVIRAEVEPQFPLRELPQSLLHKPPVKRFKKDGTPSALAMKYFDGLLSQRDGTWVVQYPDREVPLAEASTPLVTHGKMSLSNLEDIKDWLISLGWKPTMFNRVQDPDGSWRETTPKMQDIQKNICPNLIALGDKVQVVKQITLWMQLRNRRNVLRSEKGTGWLNHPRLAVDGRLPAGANTIGANTNRFTHRVVANVPRVGSFYGEEFRSLYTVPDGKYLVGWDASALEAHIEGHYTAKYDNGAYARELLEGDVHTKNMQVFQITSRSLSKNGKYALTYGCSPKKLAQTIHQPLSLAQQIYDNFWEKNWALAKVRNAVQKEWRQNGRKYITGLDGRPIITRSEHSLVNALFQSAGAICMKMAMVLYDERLRSTEWLAGKANQVIHYHENRGLTG